ncbi:unnamed protein product [Closterium sp. NIES-54]
MPTRDKEGAQQSEPQVAANVHDQQPGPLPWAVVEVGKRWVLAVLAWVKEVLAVLAWVKEVVANWWCQGEVKMPRVVLQEEWQVMLVLVLVLLLPPCRRNQQPPIP